MYAWTDWNLSQEQEISGVKYAGWSQRGRDGGEVFPEACVVEHVAWWFAARTGRVLEDLENAIGGESGQQQECDIRKLTGVDRGTVNSG